MHVKNEIYNDLCLSPTLHPLPSFFQVLGRCFLTVMQVHFQFLSQALQKVQPVAQSCLAEALAQAQERCARARTQSSALGPLAELEEASHSWKGAAQVREQGSLLTAELCGSQQSDAKPQLFHSVDEQSVSFSVV